ncbi:MAG: hypothetical protein KKH52_03100 [Nanoarchaeota archaeon]|nr:hypothetical protein [Nanoarchaeota archaeon]MBU1622579.1 hypothetical protein [Nanoarchaeota archaeon]MBU1974356.1 hypothetical protein [Nanoarchaeota archaeon]
MIKKIMIVVSLLAMLIIVGCSSGSENYDALAQCLTENEVVMYGTEWCSHCQNQKAAFGKSFQYVNYIDCDQNKDACTDAGVTGYPTWSVKGKNYPGEQPLERLASLAGC